MDQRLEKLEQIQKEIQEQMQAQMQEQLAKIQPEKGKSPVTNTEDDSEILTYAPGFTPTNTPVPPQGVSTNIKPQYQTGTSVLINFPTGSCSNPEDNCANPMALDLDNIAKEEKARAEFPEMDAKELSLVPDLVLPPKFKMPEFEKYSGTNYPEAHITMFCRRMTGHVNNDQLLIHCFQDNLAGAAAKWQCAQRWREVATQVQLPLLEKETTMLFINTLKAPFINHMLESATKSFADIVISVEMIENVIRCGKIEAGESNRRSAPKKRENEVSNVSMSYAKPIIVNQPKAVATGQQASARQESNTKQSTKKFWFIPIPITYRELYKSLFDAHVVSSFYLKLLQPPYPKWYDASAQCEYHAGITGHSIENCTSFKRVVERLINMGVVKFDDAPSVGNPLPNHTDDGVNAIVKNMVRRIKLDVAEVKAPMREGLMDNKELKIFEFTEEEDVCTRDEGSMKKVNHPVVIISRPKINEAGARIMPRVVIQKPAAFRYKDSKKVF
ncbi:uncharacterized protein LOC108468459 [Gossypium arboreum]|uniref:uncharacterized protein LOC108468459 n=1 Tax=Gossypium arboreum TaxID=29729 RepID=UPI00081926EE|nr:uncharacterized protein LOC108468459 [Gossypium arboreum]